MALTVLAGAAFATNITTHVVNGSLRVENSGGAQLATCSFDVIDKSGSMTVLVPEGPVRVTDGATTIFEGLIRNRTRIRIVGESKKRYRIGCQDYTSLLTDDVIDDLATRSTSESDKVRIEYWLTTYGTKGVTSGATVQTVAGAMPPQEPGGMNLYEAIADVCKLTGARFYVGQNKALHYFVTESSASTWDFSDSPNYTTTYPYSSLELPDDTVELVNAVFVIGNGVTAWRTDGTSITAYGRKEGTLRDQTLTTVAQCEAAGDAYLAAYANPRQSATVKWRNKGQATNLVAGMTIHVTDSRWGLAFSQFTVSKVSVSVGQGNSVEYEAQLSDGVIDLGSLFGGSSQEARKALTQSSIGLQYAQESVGRVKVVAVLPTLPDADYPQGQLVLLTTDSKVYRNTDGSTWSRAIDGAAITDGGDILANTITAGAIFAGAVGAEALAAKIVLAGQIIAGTDGGARNELDSAGITLFNASSVPRAKLPTDGSAVWVKGEIEADSLTSTTTAELRGTTTIPSQAVISVAEGVVKPAAAPTLTAGWDTHTLGTATPPSAGYTFSYVGNGYYDAAGGSGGATACYVSTVKWVKSGSADIWQVIEWRVSDWVVDRQTTLTGLTMGANFNVYGTTRISGDWYLAAGDDDTTPVSRVTKVTRSTGAQSATATRTGNEYFDIATNGSVLYVACLDGIVETWTTTPSYSSSKTLTGGTGAINGIEYDGTDWWITEVGTTPKYVSKFTVSTGAKVANTAFPISTSASNGRGGVYWDGTVFHSGIGNSATAQVVDHTTWDWTTASAVYWVGYSWYDPDGTTHETELGPRASITMGRRQRLQVTTAPIPGTGGAEEPDNCRVYMAPNASQPAAGSYKLQSTDALTSRYLTTYASGGAADPTTNGFNSVASPGEIKAAITAGWSLKGDGKLLLPSVTAVTTDGVAAWDATNKALAVGDGTLAKFVTPVGWLPFAGGPGVSNESTFTVTRTLAGNGGGSNAGAAATPIYLPAPMKLTGIAIHNSDTTGTRTGIARLYVDRTNSTTQDYVTGTEASFSFTASAAQFVAVTLGSPVYLAPGLYWLVFRNGGNSNAWGLGSTPNGSTSFPGASGSRFVTTASVPALGSTINITSAISAIVSPSVAGMVLIGTVLGD